jgi:hypothetical protein
MRLQRMRGIPKVRQSLPVGYLIPGAFTSRDFQDFPCGNQYHNFKHVTGEWQAGRERGNLPTAKLMTLMQQLWRNVTQFSGEDSYSCCLPWYLPQSKFSAANHTRASLFVV